MYTLDDTIAAISTPPGRGGIGIVRLSGPEALPIAHRLVHVRGAGTGARLAPQRLYLGQVVDPATGRCVDEVLLSYMRAPRSYTREDVVEINAHGGPVPLREILALCLAAGARHSAPGEFTLRAFLNGRLDLAQAEAVLDVINARTSAALAQAVGQLDGRLSQQVQRVRRTLLEARTHLEAEIDFPEEDLGEDALSESARALGTAAEALDALLAEAERGMLYREGLRVVLVGRPNVGKSSLLNRLLRRERAIVTPVPGTTRDTLEESVVLAGIPLVLVDTAGIAEARDVVERLGIDRSKSAAERADLALLVVDASAPLSPADAQVAALLSGRPTIVVLNKGDLPRADDYAALAPGAPHVGVSAATGAGLEDLEAIVVRAALGEERAAQVLAGGDDPATVSNPRHRAALARAREAVRAALSTLVLERAPELVAVDVQEALEALGEITGEAAGEELLEAIFAQFCIGK